MECSIMADINVDMWYGNSVKEADCIDIAFYDSDCEYRGNIYKNGKAIGDYSAKNSLAIEKRFSHLKFKWQ